nr:14249_t:CDS:2 [Entrophospora candida]
MSENISAISEISSISSPAATTASSSPNILESDQTVNNDNKSKNNNHHHNVDSLPQIKLPFPPVIDPSDLIHPSKPVTSISAFDEPHKPSRAPNAFIIYRKAFVKAARDEGHCLPMTVISSMASAAWEKESEEVKTEYKRISKEAHLKKKAMIFHWMRLRVIPFQCGKEMFRRLSNVSNVASTNVLKGGVGGNSSGVYYIGNLFGNNGCVYGRGLFGAVANLLKTSAKKPIKKTTIKKKVAAKKAAVPVKKAALPKITKPEPKRPKMPYSIFFSEEYKMEIEKDPTLTVPRIGKILGEKWRNLPDDMKESYKARYIQEREEYKKNYEKWYNSLTVDDIKLENKHRRLRKRRGKKLLKIPNMPKRPTSSYIYFVVKNMDVNDGEKSTVRVSKLAEKWRNLLDKEKKVYQDLSEKDKKRYLDEMVEFEKKQVVA